MRDPNAIISTEALAALLGQPNLHVYDCTTYNNPPPPDVDEPYIPLPGLASFREAHIPGADFLDLQGEFSDGSQRYWFMMPKDLAQLEAAFARHGIGEGVRVVLYSIGSMMWSTRFWWMLRSLGFDNVAVLDGGFDKWKVEGRATESGDAKGYPAATFNARPRSALFVDKHETLAAIGATDTVTVNALGPQFHRGLEPSRYGRPGRVPGSVNVSAATLIDPATKGFTTLADATAKLEVSGVTKEKRSSAIAVAASPQQSTSSSCINSVTTTSRSTTARWANGPKIQLFLLRRTDVLPIFGITIERSRAAMGRTETNWHVRVTSG
jgi:thiosulfate/3-mercaptopyruvate sulfurtransferase